MVSHQAPGIQPKPGLFLCPLHRFEKTIAVFIIRENNSPVCSPQHHMVYSRTRLFSRRPRHVITFLVTIISSIICSVKTKEPSPCLVKSRPLCSRFTLRKGPVPLAWDRAFFVMLPYSSSRRGGVARLCLGLIR